ncbi:hypothetical protein CRG98_001613 [Punica granatum]|uniref:Uncharacterized protein n=1 Tax=Punica granatum TaxID=22663 RepID=A0A2I0LBD1_PUNGR|nr:hypothetical protein CRG98_001613 [Punica granatum]
MRSRGRDRAVRARGREREKREGDLARVGEARLGYELKRERRRRNATYSCHEIDGGWVWSTQFCASWAILRSWVGTFCGLITITTKAVPPKLVMVTPTSRTQSSASARRFDPQACGWAFGFNAFDLQGYDSIAMIRSCHFAESMSLV